jgi:hypothetical protein
MRAWPGAEERSPTIGRAGVANRTPSQAGRPEEALGGSSAHAPAMLNEPGLCCDRPRPRRPTSGYSTEIQQQEHELLPECVVRHRVLSTTSAHRPARRKFGTKRSQVQILSPRLIERAADLRKRVSGPFACARPPQLDHGPRQAARGHETPPESDRGPGQAAEPAIPPPQLDHGPNLATSQRRLA